MVHERQAIADTTFSLEERLLIALLAGYREL